jgi:hypothetical protein
MFAFVAPLGSDRPTGERAQDLHPGVQPNAQWRLVFRQCQEVIARPVIGEGRLRLIIALHALVPDAGLRHMDDLPSCPPDSDTPLGLFPIDEIVSIQHARLFDG